MFKDILLLSMTRILRDFISLFYPRNCINCKVILSSAEEHICFHCMIDLPLAEFHKYDQNPMMQKLCTVPRLKMAFAYLLFTRGGIAQKMVHKIKYARMPELGYQLGQWFGYNIKDTLSTHDVDIIAPIPLHRSRLKQRGYNQSERIATGLSDSLCIPCAPDLMTRCVHNPTQTRKSKADRWINTERLFEVAGDEQVKGKHVMLVDDVLTTGATMESALQQLVRSGASKVSVACLASKS